MQFREQGKKIQLIGYRGYVGKADAAKLGVKAGAQVKFLGTIDPHTFELVMASDKATGKPFELSDKERAEVDAYIAEKQTARKQLEQAGTMRTAVQFMHMASDALKAGHAFEIQPHHQPEQLWTSLIALEKALVAAGHQRPKRAYKPRKPAADTRTRQLPIEGA